MLRSQKAFTLIELLVVLSIITILGLMAVPGTARAIARGAVNKAADDILRVAHQAQNLAQRAVPTGPTHACPHWGVAIVASADHHVYATVLHGTNGNDEWEVDGQPGFRVHLADHMRLYADLGSGLELLDGRMAWFYQYGTGWPIAAPDQQVPISIGTQGQAAQSADRISGSGSSWKGFAQAIPAIPPSPVARGLVVAPLAGRYRVAIAIYDYGLSAVLGHTTDTP